MKDLKTKIEKQTITAKPRNLNTAWTAEDLRELRPVAINKPVMDMTELEKEVEVIRRLTEPPKKESLSDVIAEQLAAEIALEIDIELLNSISLYVEQSN